MKLTKNRLRRIIREEVSLLNEASIRLDDEEGAYGLVIGRYCAMLLDKIYVYVNGEIGSRANIQKVRNKGPVAKLSASWLDITGYTRSDIQASVTMRALFMRDRILIDVQSDHPQYGRTEQEWEFHERDNPSKLLENVGDFIIENIYGYI